MTHDRDAGGTGAFASKPASASRTLRFNRLAMVWTGFLAFLPNILVDLFPALISDPAVAKAVTDFVPAPYRALIFAIVFAITQRNRQLRYQTSQPITK